MSDKKITVLKFGGSVLRDKDDLALAVHEIYRHWRNGSQVLAVVSAFYGTTDSLLEQARSIDDDPHPEALATLLLTGEATSSALLGLALKRSGIPSKILTPAQVGILTEGDPLDAQPVTANIDRLKAELEKAVVVVSGFAGVKNYGELTLLGRGGTDYTALFLADKLKARCILVKDVDGLYESNPADTTKHPRRYAIASYRTTLKVGGELVQEKAVKFAESRDLEFEIAALGTKEGTRIGHSDDVFVEFVHSSRTRLKVALLGCGTVGGGVYNRLVSLRDRFEIVGVLNLDPEKAVRDGVAREHLKRNAKDLIESDCDVVIELIGGLDLARELTKFALTKKRHVITANKALLACDGALLEDLAEQNGVTLRYSASVGGALPALEAVERATRSSRPKAIRGIINGTCNFICDQLATGVELEAAIEAAKREGFAEADPTLDLDGTDAAQKLVLLVKASFGVDLPLTNVKRVGINSLDPAAVRKAGLKGRSFRLVAECRRTPAGIEASVQPVEVSAGDPFAATRGAENCLVIETENGRRTVVRGVGAGRHATTEAVMADLFDLRNLIGNQGLKSYYREANA